MDISSALDHFIGPDGQVPPRCDQRQDATRVPHPPSARLARLPAGAPAVGCHPRPAAPLPVRNPATPFSLNACLLACLARVLDRLPARLPCSCPMTAARSTWASAPTAAPGRWQTGPRPRLARPPTPPGRLGSARVRTGRQSGRSAWIPTSGATEMVRLTGWAKWWCWGVGWGCGGGGGGQLGPQAGGLGVHGWARGD